LWGSPCGRRTLVTWWRRCSLTDAIDTARTLTHALDAQAISVALTTEQRSAILAALEFSSRGLGELRGVLVRQALARSNLPAGDV
jgi:hypothetical protein